jgi:hypothetical protein
MKIEEEEEDDDDEEDNEEDMDDGDSRTANSAVDITEKFIVDRISPGLAADMVIWKRFNVTMVLVGEL